MSIYLLCNILFIIVSILYIKIEPRIRSKDRKYIIFFFIIVFSVLMGVRPLETPDTLGYVQNFEYFQSGQKYPVNLFQKYMGYEYGYIYLIRFFKLFSDSYRLFFFFTALLGTSLTIFGLKKLSDRIEVNHSGMYAPVFAAYISSYALLYNGISIRAGLAMGIGIAAVNFMLDKRWIRGLLLLFVAFTIQRIALLLLIAFIAIRFMPSLRRRTYVGIWLFGGILLLSGYAGRLLPYMVKVLNVIITKFQMSGFAAYLLDLESDIGIRSIYCWFLYGILILFLCYSKNYEKYLNVVMVGFFIVVFMHGVRAIARAYDMFYLFSVPLFGAMYNENANSICIKRERQIKILIIISINAMLMLKLCFG